MMWSRNRLCCLFLALIVLEDAYGLGVWQNRLAYYWQSGGGSKDPRDQALSPAQQDFDSTASGTPTAAYDVGSAQPLTTTGSGDSATNVSGFLRQYTISSDQNVQQTSLTQSQGGYTAQSSDTSGSITWLLLGGRNQAAPGFQSQLLSSPVSLTQGSSSQAFPPQQSSLQLASSGQIVSSPSQSFTASYVPGTQAQSSSSATSSLGVASATSQQVGYGSQSAASTLYGYTPSQGQGAQPSFQFQTSPYKPQFSSQGLGSQPLASQLGSLQCVSPSLSLTTNYVSGSQNQPSSPATSSLSSTSAFATTSQQATNASQLAAVYGQPSSFYSSTQSQSVQVPSQSADAPYKPVVNMVDAYTAGPAKWYMVGPFGQTGQANKPLFPSQASGSQGSQASPSRYPATPQSQSNLGSLGAPASTVSLTQSAVQEPSFQTPSGLSTSFSTTSPSASASQPIQGGQSSVTWQTQGVPTSFGPSTPGQAVSLATTQQYSRDASQSTGSSATQEFSGFLSQRAPVSITQNVAQLPSFQTPTGFLTTSYSTAGPSGSVSPGYQVVSSSSPATSQTQSNPGYFGLLSQSVPSTLTQSADQVPSFQSPSGLSTTSFGATSPSASAALPFQGGSVTWQSQGVPASLGQSTSGHSAPVATAQQYSMDALQSTSFSATQAVSGFPSQRAPVSTATFTQNAAQLPSFQAPTGFSTTSFSAVGPSDSVSPGYLVASSSYPSASQAQSNPGYFGLLSQSAPASTVTLTQSASQLPSFQTPTGLSATSFSAASPSASASQPIQQGQSSVSRQSSGVSSSFGQVAPVATFQQYSMDSYPSSGFSSTQLSQGPAFQSSASHVGSLDQYIRVSSAASGASTPAQSTPVNLGLLQGFSNQAFGAFGQQQPAMVSSVDQTASEEQAGSTVSGSTSYSFPLDLNKPILFKPAIGRVQDRFSVKH